MGPNVSLLATQKFNLVVTVCPTGQILLALIWGQDYKDKASTVPIVAEKSAPE